MAADGTTTPRFLHRKDASRLQIHSVVDRMVLEIVAWNRQGHTLDHRGHMRDLLAQTHTDMMSRVG